MRRYRAVVRTGLATLMIPGILFVYLTFYDEPPFELGTLFLAAIVAGILVGISGSLIEAHSPSLNTYGQQVAVWLGITTLVVYVARWLVPFWPITFFGALIVGIIVALLETAVMPRYPVQ